MQRQHHAIAWVLLVVAFASTAALAMMESEFEVPAWTITSGGGTVTGGEYELHASFGQAYDDTPATGEDFAVRAGFVPGAPPPPPCPADINGDGEVDVEDLIEVVVGWGVCAPPAPCADTNGDGGVDVDDLMAVIVAWGPCP